MCRSISWLLVAISVACAADARAEDKAPEKSSEKPIRALLVIGGCCHDYGAQKDLLTKGLSERAPIEWTIAYDTDSSTKHLNPVYENPDWAKNFDVVVHDECSSDVKDEETIAGILKPHRAGLPAVVLHCGMHSYRSKGYPEATPWFEFTGLASTGHGPQQPIEVIVLADSSPITAGLKNWRTVNEELYNNSAGKLHETAKPLARGKQLVRDANGKETTVDAIVAWTNLYQGKTRVFATTLGHNNETVGDPRYLDFVARGLLWSVGRLK